MLLARLLSVIGVVIDDPGANAGIIERLEAQLQTQTPERLQYLAGFAGELARVADAEDGISAAEESVIKAKLCEHGHLSGAETDIIIDLLRHEREVLHRLQNHVLNRAINTFASESEKATLLDCLYAVAAADQLVSDTEEREIRVIADALLIPHSVIIDIRLRYRDRIETLRAMQRGRS